MNKFEYFFRWIKRSWYLLCTNVEFSFFLGNLPNDKPETKPDLNRSNESVSTAYLYLCLSIYKYSLTQSSLAFSLDRTEKKKRSSVEKSTLKWVKILMECQQFSTDIEKWIPSNPIPLIISHTHSTFSIEFLLQMIGIRGA